MPPVQYADVSFYDDYVGESGSVEEARKIRLLQSASALYDSASRTAPGHWGPVPDTTYTFDSKAGPLLWLLDASGRTYHLRSVDADKIEIDDDLDGTVEYALDLSDAWVKGYPRNAVALGEAFTAIEIVASSSASPAKWPTVVGGVTIGPGDWGLESVPLAVQARVCDIAHGLSQRGFAGGYGTEEREQVEAVPAWVVKLVDREFSHWIPSLG